MNISTKFRKQQDGQALVFVLLVAVISLTVLAALMRRTATNSLLNDRSNRYFATISAAEAATEKSMAALMWDYSRAGAAQVASQMGSYAVQVPTAEEHSMWNRYQFEDLDGVPGQVSVEQVSQWTAGSALISQYDGLSGYASTFRVTSVARERNRDMEVAGQVRQEFQLATIPIFQFAIFYNLDMEINPGPNMTVGGRVHSNQEVYAQPVSTLTFEDDVTAAGQIIHDKKSGDPSNRNSGTINYDGEHDSGVTSLNLPIGTDNTPDNIRQIIEQPPETEHASSQIGQQRFYNQSDLVVVVTDGATSSDPPVIELSGDAAASLGADDLAAFMQFTNVTFYNAREDKTVKAVQMDVGSLRATTTGINSVYVDDLRAQSSYTQPGLRLVNGQTLPDGGLTISTRLPLYVKGHYNAPSSTLGTSDTSQTQPAALIADALTVLSGSWNDASSTAGLSSRVASHTTVNAAILAGIVETSQETGYSGGVENFPRFLEKWSGKTLTYNGSMVVMFPSAIATGEWHYGGNFYTAPSRNWYFDTNFLNPEKLPPLTPQARTTIRGQWTMGAASNPAG